ncbi:MAG: NUDIX hydrolase [Candidatus Gracilibacteria bacterium]|nr:NUDIX hydrolase [Candidatus Gracilibacteria bacterium]
MKKIKKASLICFYNNKNQILLQERGDYSKHGEDWGFFGGGIEKGETALDAFYREAKEELGLDMDDFEVEYLGEFRFDLIDRIAYRNLFIIKTDMREVDFTVYEGVGAKYFSIEKARTLKFPSPVDGVIDIYENYILGKQNTK